MSYRKKYPLTQCSNLNPFENIWGTIGESIKTQKVKIKIFLPITEKRMQKNCTENLQESD